MGANECLTRQTRLCYAHANNVCISRRIENTEKHTLMLLHFIFFVMFLQAWKINTQNTHCGICGSKKLLFVFPWFLHDDDTVNYGFSCWQRDCGAQRERAINWWGICKQFTETMEQSGQLILTIPGLWPNTGASVPFLVMAHTHRDSRGWRPTTTDIITAVSPQILQIVCLLYLNMMKNRD